MSEDQNKQKLYLETYAIKVHDYKHEEESKKRQGMHW